MGNRVVPAVHRRPEWKDPSWQMTSISPFTNLPLTVCFTDYYKRILRKWKVTTCLKPVVSLTLFGVMCHVSHGSFSFVFSLDITSDSAQQDRIAGDRKKKLVYRLNKQLGEQDNIPVIHFFHDKTQKKNGIVHFLDIIHKQLLN